MRRMLGSLPSRCAHGPAAGGTPVGAGDRSEMDMARFRLFARVLWLYQRSGVRWLARHLGILGILGLDASEGLLPDIPDRFIVPSGEVYPSSGPDSSPVAFFAGCVMSTALAAIDRATIRVLQKSGCSVSNPS